MKPNPLERITRWRGWVSAVHSTQSPRCIPSNLTIVRSHAAERSQLAKLAICIEKWPNSTLSKARRRRKRKK
jgi:hypothetical protein